RDAVSHAHANNDSEALSAVAAETDADTIYHIDRLSEAAIMDWFTERWPKDQPVQLVMEGLDESTPTCFPKATPVEATKWKCILDPIDGTRAIMYDKRSAWSLAGLAPQLGAATGLSDILIGV